MDRHLDFKLSENDIGGTYAIHLGVCGSIAAYKALDILRMWRNANIDVSVTLTPSAMEFVTPLSFEALGASRVYTSMYSDLPQQSPFPHLDPNKSSKVFIIAPATADIIARIAHGFAGDLLECQALAFEGERVIAPAMNPIMWANPATQTNIEILRKYGYKIISPAHGSTACGDVGQGKLSDIRGIYLAGLYASLPKDLKGKKAIVTLGPTRERWDEVRFWTNASSGVMGASIALALWMRGADVTTIC